MKHIEEKDGKIFIDGIEYVPKENKEEFPKSYVDIIANHREYLGKKGYVFNQFGSICYETIAANTFGVFLNENFAKAMLRLKNLLEIRDEYNGNWKPDWSNSNELKYSIEIIKNKIFIADYWDSVSSGFIFKTKELAEQFFENHEEDIEFVFKHLYMWNK